MGVNLTPIMVRKIQTLDDLRGKSLAVDANNYLYQFLSLIRTRDGTPLKDSRGNITSHLAGLMFRSTRLLRDFRIDLVFVFDGKPPTMKGEEIKKRRAQREKAFREWQEALKTRDYAKAFSKAVMTSRLTRSMIEDAKTLLHLLGIPYVQAPSEAEAQAAYMAKQGDVWAASSKDYDGILFGAPKLLRFLTIQGKEYLPSKGVARPLKPELIILQQFLSHHGISRSQLIDLAILVGTDFNEGIKGIGPKTALKIIKKHRKIENLPGELAQKIPPKYAKVREIYLNPETTSEYNLLYGPLREEELSHFLIDQRDFAQKRVETIVQRMKDVYRLKKQTKLEGWFGNLHNL
ncbi:MAG: flap endonuclease-1 [Candidatus Bathyarchaeota archaeon]|nr:MAG: flap endonuclease-1 [Candidatus Bathyarchaeota archaeon]